MSTITQMKAFFKPYKIKVATLDGGYEFSKKCRGRHSDGRSEHVMQISASSDDISIDLLEFIAKYFSEQMPKCES